MDYAFIRIMGRRFLDPPQLILNERISDLRHFEKYRYDDSGNEKIRTRDVHWFRHSE